MKVAISVKKNITITRGLQIHFSATFLPLHFKTSTFKPSLFAVAQFSWISWIPRTFALGTRPHKVIYLTQMVTYEIKFHKPINSYYFFS